MPQPAQQPTLLLARRYDCFASPWDWAAIVRAGVELVGEAWKLVAFVEAKRLDWMSRNGWYNRWFDFEHVVGD